MTIGIYVLHFNNTDKVYVGQSVNIEKRYVEHLNRLSTEIAYSKLQNAYNTYGIPTLEIILECAIEDLNSAENEAIQLYNAYHDGFNSTDSAGCPDLKGYSSPNATKTREIYIGIFNNIVGKRLTLEQIAVKYSVGFDVVSNISAGRTHIWLKEEFPDLYTSMTSFHRNRSTSVGNILVDPTGIEYRVPLNITEFSKTHGLGKGLGRLLNGTRKSYLGWKIITKD